MRSRYFRNLEAYSHKSGHSTFLWVMSGSKTRLLVFTYWLLARMVCYMPGFDGQPRAISKRMRKMLRCHKRMEDALRYLILVRCIAEWVYFIILFSIHIAFSVWIESPHHLRIKSVMLHRLYGMSFLIWIPHFKSAHRELRVKKKQINNTAYGRRKTYTCTGCWLHVIWRVYHLLLNKSPFRNVNVILHKYSIPQLFHSRTSIKHTFSSLSKPIFALSKPGFIASAMWYCESKCQRVMPACVSQVHRERHLVLSKQCQRVMCVNARVYRLFAWVMPNTNDIKGPDENSG